MHRKKRAGTKSGMRGYYKGYLAGPGGLKCPCCGAVYQATKRIRRKNRATLHNTVREANVA